MDYYEAKYLIHHFSNHRKFVEENKLIVDKEGFYEKKNKIIFKR